MESIDETNERRRLEKLYAQMSDGELQALADDDAELTEVARQVLRAEICKRGLQTPVRDAPADAPGLARDDLVEVWEAADLTELQRVKGVLDSSGIAFCVGSDNLESVGGFKGSFDHGVKIKVLEQDWRRALGALAALYPPEPKDETEYAVRCPKCHSPDIVFQGLDVQPAEGTIADSKFNWTCDACGHQWKDEGLEEKP